MKVRYMLFFKHLIVILTLLAAVSVSPPFVFSGDVPVERGIIKEKGDNYIVVEISGGYGFRDGEEITFYIHSKTRIMMAHSGSPLVLDSLLIGDRISLTLGTVKIDKDGRKKRYLDKIKVLSPHKMIKR